MRTPALLGAALAMVLGMAGPIGNKTPAAPSPRNKPVDRTQPKPYQAGKASWYGDRFHGRVTASGEPFDMFAMTAAHRRLPMGSLVRVTHLLTRRSVVVRVNDRGPVVNSSMLDLSWAAAKALGGLRHGIFPVRLDLVETPSAAAAPQAELIATVNTDQ